MLSMEYPQVLLAVLLLIFTLFIYNKYSIPRNLPLFGMYLNLLMNIHRFHEWLIDVFKQTHGTFLFKGPWFSNIKMLFTADPENVHYVTSKKFSNFHKGPKFNKIFDAMGNGIFNADGDLWMYQRKMFHSFLTHPRLHPLILKTTMDKLEGGLIPFLDHVSYHGLTIDFQDLFERLTFDMIYTMVMGHDPRSLSIDLPSIPFSRAVNDAEKVTLYRHFLPEIMWKLQRLLGVGMEKRHKKAWETVDSFLYKYIDEKREKMNKGIKTEEHEDGIDLLTFCMDANKDSDHNNDKFLRDTILSFFLAGRDAVIVALCWFFYLISSNPNVKDGIMKELEAISGSKNDVEEHYKEVNEKLVYLHAALCESLRLYPPVAFESKTPLQPDTLPSGHRVDPSMQIIFDLYAMGRMKSIWGNDCHEFKPERWISDKGKIKHEPSYKFFTFHAGPRTCLGKDMTFTQMKVIASTIFKNYHIEMVKEHPVVYELGVALRMKHGLKFKVMKISK